MDVRKEIDKFSEEEDKPILHWLFDRYHTQHTWSFVASCYKQRYGKLSYETNRIWFPNPEGRMLYDALNNPKNTETTSKGCPFCGQEVTIKDHRLQDFPTLPRWYAACSHSCFSMGPYETEDAAIEAANRRA